MWVSRIAPIDKDLHYMYNDTVDDLLTITSQTITPSATEAITSTPKQVGTSSTRDTNVW